MKVVLGGQGGDEIFGGYARYLLAYFEQCIKAAIDGTMHAGNFVVTYESIIPQLGDAARVQADDAGVLARRTVRRSRRALLPPDQPGARSRTTRSTGTCSATTRRSRPSRTIFRADNVRKESYFDAMTHFDFKTLLPALLHVEDRVSMAHGLESRVPFVDAEVVEFAATLPADVKFKDGQPEARAEGGDAAQRLPTSIVDRARQDGLPGAARRVDRRASLRDFVLDSFSGVRSASRARISTRASTPNN